MAHRTCSEPDCGSTDYYAVGLCRSHYDRRLTTDPRAALRDLGGGMRDINPEVIEDGYGPSDHWPLLGHRQHLGMDHCSGCVEDSNEGRNDGGYTFDDNKYPCCCRAIDEARA
jgi:hypothetical protein